MLLPKLTVQLLQLLHVSCPVCTLPEQSQALTQLRTQADQRREVNQQEQQLAIAQAQTLLDAAQQMSAAAAEVRRQAAGMSESKEGQGLLWLEDLGQGQQQQEAEHQASEAAVQEGLTPEETAARARLQAVTR